MAGGISRFDGAKGRLRSASRRRRPTRNRERLRWAAAMVALAALLAVASARFDAGEAWMLAGATYLFASVLTFASYRRDKVAANRGEWRVPESTLHVLALLGGWPGAFLAQVSLRHKTIKGGFQTVFWLTVVANLAVLALLPNSWIAETVALTARLLAEV